MDEDSAPVLATEPQEPSLPATSSARTPWLVAGAFGIATVLFLALWLGAKGDADEAKSELDQIEQAAEAEQAEADALPDLEALAYDHLTSDVIDSASEDSVSLTFYREPTGPLGDLLDELGFSSGIMGRIGNTRALDGTLTAEAPHVQASWTYHPDDGLSMVLERTE